MSLYSNQDNVLNGQSNYKRPISTRVWSPEQSYLMWRPAVPVTEQLTEEQQEELSAALILHLLPQILLFSAKKRRREPCVFLNQPQVLRLFRSLKKAL